MTANFNIRPAYWVAIAIAALAAALALPAGAVAANDCAAAGSDPTAAQYCNSNQNVAPTSAEEGASEEGTSEGQVAAATGGGGSEGGEGGGSLPFTGTDLLALAAVAAAFVAIGLALKRMATARPGAH